jgi:anthranilate/para-aminobenzoate synthase component I
MSLNIAIRTMVQLGETVHAYAGGAIVAESIPQREYEEILAKAAGMFRALQGETWANSLPTLEVTVV